MELRDVQDAGLGQEIGDDRAWATRLRSLAVATTLVLLPIHLWLAGRLELSFDEAY